MLIYLYGSDSYRRQTKLREIVGEYKKKHAKGSVDKFYLQKDEEYNRLTDFIKSQSLFDKSKLAIVDMEDGKFTTKTFVALLKSLVEVEDIVLMLISPKALPKEFKFLLKKPITSQEFKELKGASLDGFIRRAAADRGLKASKEISGALMAVNGSNVWGIVNDLDKMALGGKLEEGIATHNFFVAINRLVRGDIAALTWLLATDDAAKIFNITSSFAKDSDGLQKMADYDVAIKSGKFGYDEALLDLVLSH
ncbi:MAG: hypothetical protein Q8O87_03300 [bacterium]|nr:hypothetical protein [bacterium]